MLRIACRLACRVRLPKNCIRPVSSKLSCRRNYSANGLNFGSQETLISNPKFMPCGGASFMQNVLNPACDIIENEDSVLGRKYCDVMIKALLFEVSKALEAGADARDLRRGINAAVDIVIAYFKRTTRMVHTPKEIAQVATALANGDSELGNFIAKGMEKVGKDALHIIARNNELNNEVEFVNAMKLQYWGLNSSSFITNKRKKICLLKNPLILIIVDKILNKNVVQIVQQAMTPACQRRPLLIIGENVEREVYGSLMPDGSRPRKKLCVVEPPTYFRSIATFKPIMEDIAIFTGAQVVTGEPDVNIPQMLGSCKEVTISYDNMFIFGAAGDQTHIDKRCEQLRFANFCTHSFDERIARLSQAVRFKVGGASSYNKVDYAVHATKMAMHLGILPGGGVALLNASKELHKLETKYSDHKHAFQLLQNVLKMPVYAIASAAGFDGSISVEKLLEQDNPELGYDPATDDYIEMFKSGNIDTVDSLISQLKYVKSFVELEDVTLHHHLLVLLLAVMSSCLH